MRSRIGALAAALLLASSARAWSPPKRDAEIKARPCPEVGEGYVHVPGSATCVRLSGLVRVEGARIGGAR